MPSLPTIRLIAAVIFVGVGSSLIAADPKPGTLTPQQIADGWILIFDGESTFGWTGKAEVKDGKLMVAKGETIRFALPLPPGELEQEPGAELLKAEPLGTKQAGITTRQGTAEAVHMQFVSPSVLSISGGTKGGAISQLRYRPKRTKSLFNGKDLTGWTIFKDEKRNKSAWSVTADGELALKNGPGDLQTEGKYDNFLFQLECKTNGTALNSGVFFRCIDDQYQNGYEMQIQNAYKDGDRSKPADFGTGAIYRRIPARKVVANDKEWFSMTLVAHGPHIATWVNGYPVVSWKDERPLDENPRKGLRTSAGHLSIQGHDPTTDLLFRNIRIVEWKTPNS